MKEKYMKPCLVTESFELSQSIATSCGAPHCDRETGIRGATAGDPGSCKYGVGDGVVFIFNTGAGTGCTMDYDADVMSFYCYNNPGGSLSIFGS